ncbi:uncharacterized protein LOC6730853 [Drosophila simulans]|uniref:GD23224 n=1 Tax=Drosophila simulans TaxID=7240 RepID=B4Q963_DROSI|nr:uncharacterized protein LOC6730853 [Drosophila simulans]EDX03602.1 GD23224 [Drosophila simulans]KMY87867.1 uncharacterized protein Dsimw501_GD23224 [Drosophila simulans]
MTSMLNTPIVSIFDLMVNRHIRLRREREGAVTNGNLPPFRRPRAERRAADGKKTPFKYNPSAMEFPLPETLELMTPPAANAITAAHLTKKHTSLKIQPPSEKDVIKKLVEKMSDGRGRTKTATPRHSQSSKKTSAKSSKTVVIQPRRRKEAGQGSFRAQPKLAKTSSTQLKRPPLSPRRAESTAKDASSQSKTKTTKNSLKKSGSQMRTTRSVDRLSNAQIPVVKRWRL